MRDRAEVHDLLHVAGAEHRKAGLTAGHHVGVVAEDVERVRSDAARGHMDDAGQQLAGDLVHIRNHQQQALRGGVRRRQSAGGKRAVHGTGSAGLRLHFDHLHRLPEYILSAVRRPLIRDLGHHRRRRDRIDAGYLRKRIGNMRCGRVAVHRYLFLAITMTIPFFLLMLTKTSYERAKASARGICSPFAAAGLLRFIRINLSYHFFLIL